MVRRTTALLATATVLVAGAATFTPAPALAAGTATMEAQFVAKMNAARQAAGLRPYAVAADLTSVAGQHSARMAARQNLYHNPSLTSDVSDWQAVGENVGEGPSVDDIHTAFMHSPEHRANILDHDYTQVGVGVTVDSKGIVWVTEDFRQPMPAVTARPAPKHHVTTAPRPTSTPARTATPHPRRAATHPRAAAPAPTATLAAKLAAVRARPAPAAADPVAAAFAYLTTVSSLNG